MHALSSLRDSISPCTPGTPHTHMCVLSSNQEFLQRLPSNVRMVLASTPDTSSLDNKLAEMAHKIVEVASLRLTMPTDVSTKVEQLSAEVSRLEKLMNSLTRLLVLLTLHVALLLDSTLRLSHTLSLLVPFEIMVIKPDDADPPAHTSQTTRPLTSGDGCCWP